MDLIESIGGKNLNAGTSYDMTFYHNSFPPYQINKWLEIYSRRIGYTDDPAKENLAKIDNLKFEDIVKFYETNLKGKPYCIGVLGNPKEIDVKRLEKYGKLVKLNERKLFNNKESLF